MTFREKIDKILETSELGINSVTGLEDKVGAGRGAINDFYNRNEEPGRKTLKRILSLPGFNQEWWKTGEGPIFIAASDKKHTQVQDKPPVTEREIREYSKDIIDLIEGKTEYLVIPRSVLKENYRIVPLEQFEKDKLQMEKDARELDQRSKQIQALTDLIGQFASRPINIQLANVEKT